MRYGPTGFDSEGKPVEYRAEKKPEMDDLEALVESGDDRALRGFLALLHPADMALVFDSLDRDQWPKVVAQLKIGQISDLMEEHYIVSITSPTQTDASLENQYTFGVK